MIVKNNFIILTGGPGSGKTTLLDALVKKGFYGIAESGRTIIRERRANGLPPRPGAFEFATQMFNADYENYLKHQNIPDLLFFDRSFLDSAALLAQIAPGKIEYANGIIDDYRYHGKVFIVPPWREIYKNDDERDQNFEEATQTYQMLADWYLSKQYQCVILPREDVDTRVKFIWNELGIPDAGN